VTDKLYIANLTQTGTSAPTASELVNTVGAIVWTRTSTGVYVGTLTGAFSPVADTAITMPSMTDVVSLEVVDTGSVKITMSGDGKLSSRELRILVSTHYCSALDLENRISRATLAQLCNDTANATIMDASVVDELLEKADVEIDAKAGQVYEVPFETTPDIVKQVAISLATHYAFHRRPTNIPLPDEWKEEFQRAIKTLDDISNMLINLPSTATISSQESDIETAEDMKLVEFNDEDHSMYDF